MVPHLTRENDEMHFFYDTRSRPAMFDFDDVCCSYIHNWQDEIVGIIDSDVELAVEYKYDAFLWPDTSRR